MTQDLYWFRQSCPTSSRGQSVVLLEPRCLWELGDLQACEWMMWYDSPFYSPKRVFVTEEPKVERESASYFAGQSHQLCQSGLSTLSVGAFRWPPSNSCVMGWPSYLVPVHHTPSVGGRVCDDKYGIVVTFHPWRYASSLRCDGGVFATSWWCCIPSLREDGQVE
jgi:hypothetical protein